jgi:hypothetical protein
MEVTPIIGTTCDFHPFQAVDRQDIEVLHIPKSIPTEPFNSVSTNDPDEVLEAASNDYIGTVPLSGPFSWSIYWSTGSMNPSFFASWTLNARARCSKIVGNLRCMATTAKGLV